MSPATPSLARLLLFAFTVALGMVVLSEYPLRWFVRWPALLACAGAGLACFILDRRATGRAGRGWTRVDYMHLARGACLLILWCEVAVIGVRFLQSSALPYFVRWEPSVFMELWERRWVAFFHIAAGVTALLLGPAQFWPGWRARALTFHRWAGRVYVVAVFVSAVSAQYLAWFVGAAEGGRYFAVSMGFLSMVWMICTGWGWRTARTGQFAAHREWMFRSYLLTLVFVTLRWLVSLIGNFQDVRPRNVLVSLFEFLHLNTLDVAVPTLVWISWVIPLALAEVAIRRARSTA